MPTKEELSKAERISLEEKRLRKNYSKLSKELKGVTEGLIREAAYMRIQLEIYRDDLDINGYVELFSQSEKTEPYERERPVARLYNTMNKNYQSITKQLSDMLPKAKNIDNKGDGFEEFVDSR